MPMPPGIELPFILRLQLQCGATQTIGLLHVVLYACQPCHVTDTIGVDGHNAR